MNDDLKIESGWSSRRLAIEECAAQTADLLARLAAVDESLSRWYRMVGTTSPDESRRYPIGSSPDAISSELARGRLKRKNGTVIDELGVGLRLWNGKSPGSAIINIRNGAYPQNWPTFANSCSIELPNNGEEAERLLTTEKLRELMVAVALSLNPEAAWAATQKMWYSIYPKDYLGPKSFGLLTYRSNIVAPVPALPDPYRVERVDNVGNLILLRNIDRFGGSNSPLLEVLRQLVHICAAG